MQFFALCVAASRGEWFLTIFHTQEVGTSLLSVVGESRLLASMIRCCSDYPVPALKHLMHVHEMCSSSHHGNSFDRIMGIWESDQVMKPLEIDDEFYLEAKAHASLNGKIRKDLVTAHLRLALQPDAQVTGRAAMVVCRELAACFAETDKLMKAAPRGPIACEHHGKSRARLETP
jgi:hypothetical protein